MNSVHTLSRIRISKCMCRPQFVKTWKSIGLDKRAGTAHAPRYAIAGRGVSGVYHTIPLCSSPTEDGIVQNMPSEARVLFMGPLAYRRGCTRHFDYFTDNTGRPNTLGNQPQDNCMPLRRSQRMVPSSTGLVQ
jgi:hypothetical protein